MNRIHIGTGSRQAKITHRKRKKEEFSCFYVLDVLLFGEPEASFVA
jgi:hypothetical protein